MDRQTETIIRDWGIFLFQTFLLITFIAIAILIYRYVRAIIRRIAFLSKLTLFCRMKNIKIQKTGSALLSIFKNTKAPELIIDNDCKRYVIKFFTPTIVKNVNINFISPNYYFLTSVKGYILFARNAGALIRTSFFKPKNIEATFLKLTHTETVEKMKGRKHLPTIDFSRYSTNEKETENILIINPIPLNIKYINANRFELLLSGDKYDNYRVYSANEFYLGFVRNNS